MSIQSNYYSINNIKDTYEETHIKRNYKNLLNRRLIMDNPKNNLNMNTYNEMNDKLCNYDLKNFGDINGCSIKSKKNFNKNPMPDFISRISDDSFISQYLPIQNQEIDYEELNKVYKNNFSYINNNKKNFNKKLNSLNELKTINEADFEKEYCYNKYQNVFSPSF